ncbi:hypothetical protein ACV35H_34075, partial [Pseudomonas aeruginosa]
MLEVLVALAIFAMVAASVLSSSARFIAAPPRPVAGGNRRCSAT